MGRIKCMPKVRCIVTIDASDEPYLKHATEENNVRVRSDLDYSIESIKK